MATPKVIPTHTHPQGPRHNPQRSKRRSPAAPAESPYDRVGYLAEARLKIERGTSALQRIDGTDAALMRAKALAEIVEEASYSDSGSEFPTESLRSVMTILQEEILVAQRLARSLYDLCREAAKPKAD